MNEQNGRIIFNGKIKGEALVSTEGISFFGGVDTQTGTVTEKGHSLEGQNVSGKILVFPKGKGSTVGSYALYRMKKNGKAPLGIINQECETIVAVGAIISEIPCVDHIDIGKIKTRDQVIINGKKITIEQQDKK